MAVMGSMRSCVCRTHSAHANHTHLLTDSSLPRTQQCARCSASVVDDPAAHSETDAEQLEDGIRA